MFINLFITVVFQSPPGRKYPNETWQVIIGFPANWKKNTFILNNVLSFVAYKMYKYKWIQRFCMKLQHIVVKYISWKEKCPHSILVYDNKVKNEHIEWKIVIHFKLYFSKRGLLNRYDDSLDILYRYPTSHF